MTCKQCGECCKILFIKISHNPMEKRTAEARGLRVFDLGKNRYVEIPQVCQHLKDNRCMVYNLRPMTCRMYGPKTAQELLPDGCGYRKEVKQ